MPFQAINRCLMASVWRGFRLESFLSRFDPSAANFKYGLWSRGRSYGSKTLPLC